MRNDYELFLSVFKRESRLFEINDCFTAGATQVYGINQETEATTDIFVYDYISSKPIIQHIKVLLIILLQAMLKTKQTIRLTDTEDHGFFSILLYKIAWMTGRLFTTERKRNWYQHICKDCFCGKKEMIHLSNDSARYLNRCIPFSYMMNITELAFEEKSFMVSSEFHNIILMSYGSDYMIPKRDEKNIQRHERFHSHFFNK